MLKLLYRLDSDVDDEEVEDSREESDEDEGSCRLQARWGRVSICRFSEKSLDLLEELEHREVCDRDEADPPVEFRLCSLELRG